MHKLHRSLSRDTSLMISRTRRSPVLDYLVNLQLLHHSATRHRYHHLIHTADTIRHCPRTTHTLECIRNHEHHHHTCLEGLCSPLIGQEASDQTWLGLTEWIISLISRLDLRYKALSSQLRPFPQDTSPARIVSKITRRCLCSHPHATLADTISYRIHMIPARTQIAIYLQLMRDHFHKHHVNTAVVLTTVRSVEPPEPATFKDSVQMATPRLQQLHGEITIDFHMTFRCRLVRLTRRKLLLGYRHRSALDTYHGSRS
jgi:hypothetical protein